MLWVADILKNIVERLAKLWPICYNIFSIPLLIFKQAN